MSNHNSLFPPVNEPGTKPPQVVSLKLANGEVPLFIGAATAEQRVSVSGMPNLAAVIEVREVPVQPTDEADYADGVPRPNQGHRQEPYIRPVPHIAVIDVISSISDTPQGQVRLEGSRLVMSRADLDNTIVPIQALRVMKEQDPTVDANDWINSLPETIFLTDEGVLDRTNNYSPAWFAGVYVLDDEPSRVDIIMNTNLRDKGMAPVYTKRFASDMGPDDISEVLPSGHVVVGSIGLGALPQQLPGSGVNSEIVPFNIEGPRDPRAASLVDSIRAITTGHMVTQLVNGGEPISRVRDMYRALAEGGQQDAGIDDSARLDSDHLAAAPTGTDAASRSQDRLSGALHLVASDDNGSGRRRRRS